MRGPHLRRAAAAAAALTWALALAGCWDYTDIDRRGIVLGIGVEFAQGEEPLLDVTVDIANPSVIAGGGGGPLTGSAPSQGALILTQRAGSVAEALHSLQARVDRRLALPFVQVVILHEEVARRALGTFLDFALRDADLRSSVCMMVTPESPRDLFHFQPTLGPESSVWLTLASENYTIASTFPRCLTMRLLHSELAERGVSVTPRVMWGPDDRPILDGAAVLASGGLVGWLDARETQGVLWWRRELVEAILTVPCTGDGQVVFTARQSGRHLALHEELGEPGVTLRLGVRAAVREVSEECPLSGKEAAVDDQVLSGLQKAVFDQAWGALEAARRLDADFLEIGLSLRRRYPRRFREIAQGRVYVPEVVHLPVSIEIDATIAEFGELN